MENKTNINSLTNNQKISTILTQTQQLPTKVELQEIITTRGLSGISNFGATCYMNAALQSLNSTRPFVAYMIHPKSNLLEHLERKIIDDLVIKYKKKNNEKEKENNIELDISKSEINKRAKKTLPYKLRLMMKRLWAHNCEVRPNQLKQSVDINLTFFLGGSRQHDSHEFLTEILNNIHESTKSECVLSANFDQQTINIESKLKVLESELINGYKQKNAEVVKIVLNNINELYVINPIVFLKIKAFWAWNEILKSSYSVINDIFSGMSMTTVTCSSCNKLTHKFERIDLLTLHLPENNNNKYTLTELLTNYTSIEPMINANKYYCNYCGTKTDAIKQSTIYQQPNVLVIVFKKYIKHNGSIIKSNIKINYNHILDIKDFMSDHVGNIGNTTYELYSVIRHTGGCNGGHYYTYTKNMINGLWYLNDDGDVYNVNDDEPLKCNGYILFYRQIKTV